MAKSAAKADHAKADHAKELSNLLAQIDKKYKPKFKDKFNIDLDNLKKHPFVKSVISHSQIVHENNMVVLPIDATAYEEIFFAAFGDLHVGVSDGNYERYLKEMEAIRGIENIFVLFLGDEANNNNLNSHGPGEDVLRIEEQLAFVSLLYQYMGDQVKAILGGNHDGKDARRNKGYPSLLKSAAVAAGMADKYSDYTIVLRIKMKNTIIGGHSILEVLVDHKGFPYIADMCFKGHTHQNQTEITQVQHVDQSGKSYTKDMFTKVEGSPQGQAGYGKFDPSNPQRTLTGVRIVEHDKYPYWKFAYDEALFFTKKFDDIIKRNKLELDTEKLDKIVKKKASEILKIL